MGEVTPKLQVDVESWRLRGQMCAFLPKLLSIPWSDDLEDFSLGDGLTEAFWLGSASSAMFRANELLSKRCEPRGSSRDRNIELRWVSLLMVRRFGSECEKYPLCVRYCWSVWYSWISPSSLDAWKFGGEVLVSSDFRRKFYNTKHTHFK